MMSVLVSALLEMAVLRDSVRTVDPMVSLARLGPTDLTGLTDEAASLEGLCDRVCVN